MASQPLTLDIWIKAHADQAINDLKRVGQAQNALSGPTKVRSTQPGYPTWVGAGSPGATGFGSGMGTGNGVSPADLIAQHYTAIVAAQGAIGAGGHVGGGGTAPPSHGGRLWGVLRGVGMLGGAAEAMAGSGGALGGGAHILGGLGAVAGMVPGPVGAIASVGLAGMGAALGSINNLASGAYKTLTDFWTNGIYQRLGVQQKWGSFYHYINQQVLSGQGKGGLPGGQAIGEQNLMQFMGAFNTAGGFAPTVVDQQRLHGAMYWGQLMGVNQAVLGQTAAQGLMMNLRGSTAFGPNMTGVTGRAYNAWGAPNVNLALSTIAGVRNKMMADGATPFMAAAAGGTGSTADPAMQNMMLMIGSNPMTHQGYLGANALTPVGAAAAFSQASSAAMNMGTLSSPASMIAVQEYMKQNHVGLVGAQHAIQTNPMNAMIALARFAGTSGASKTVQTEMFAQAMGMTGNIQGAGDILRVIQSHGYSQSKIAAALKGLTPAEQARLKAMGVTPENQVGAQQAHLLAGLQEDALNFKSSVTRFSQSITHLTSWLDRATGNARNPSTDAQGRPQNLNQGVGSGLGFGARSR